LAFSHLTAPAGQVPGVWAQAYHCGSAAGLGLRGAGADGARRPDSTCCSVEWGTRGMGRGLKYAYRRKRELGILSLECVSTNGPTIIHTGTGSGALGGRQAGTGPHT